MLLPDAFARYALPVALIGLASVLYGAWLTQFPAEPQIFLGTFDVLPAVAAIAALGILGVAGAVTIAIARPSIAGRGRA